MGESAVRMPQPCSNLSAEARTGPRLSRSQSLTPGAPGLELGELLVEPLGPLHAGEGRLQVILGQLEERSAPGGLLPHLVLHAAERRLGRGAGGLVRRLPGARAR